MLIVREYPERIVPKEIPAVAETHEHSRNKLLAFAALLTFLTLSIGYSCARGPWWDEGVFADVALNFRNLGHLGSTTLDPDGYLHFPAVNQYTYWQFPLYLMSVGTWLRFVPPTVQWMRFFSVGFGLLYIFFWFLFIRSVTRNRNLALLVAATVSLDYACVSAASDGRMDMMCAALGQGAIASYVSLRDKNWNLAVALAACFGAGAFFSHPMGLIANLCLAVLMILDWRAIRWPGLVAATGPFLLGGSLCLRYVLEAPQIYLAQSTSASAYRISTIGGIIRNLYNDAYCRYFLYYGGNLHGLDRLKIFCLLFGFVGICGLLLNRGMRALSVSKLLLTCAAVAYLSLAVLDNQKLPVYFVHSVPIFSACGAIWAHHCWKRKGLQRIVASGLLAASMLGTVGGFAFKILQNDYQTAYMPVIELVRRVAPPRAVVMGGSELGFGLGFGPPLRDDRYLGFFSKISPAVFVQNQYYGSSRQLPWIWSRRELAKNFHVAFANKFYKVYVRNDIR